MYNEIKKWPDRKLAAEYKSVLESYMHPEGSVGRQVLYLISAMEKEMRKRDFETSEGYRVDVYDKDGSKLT